jgi:hypothetical protein
MPLGDVVNTVDTTDLDWESVQHATKSGTRLSDRPQETMGSSLDLEATRYSYVNVWRFLLP